MKDGLGNDIKAGDLVTCKLPSADIVCRISHIQDGFASLILHLPTDEDGIFGRLLALKEPTSLIARPN